MEQKGQRELLMASGLVCRPDAPGRYPDRSGRYEVNIEMSESGWADLSRLQLLGVRRASSGAFEHVDILPLTVVEAIRVHNTRELVRGQGSEIAAPAGVFSPFRQYVPIQLGQWWLEGGNTVSIRLRSDVGSTESPPAPETELAYSAAFPFLPDNKREFKVHEDLDERSRAYVGSRIHSCSWGSSSPHEVEVRFDQDGVVDLNSLQILPNVELKTEGNLPYDYSHGVATIAIESIELPTRQELILGGNSTYDLHLAVPGGIFASLGRRYHWVRFGYLEVSTNSTLRVRFNDLTYPSPGNSCQGATDYSLGLQFFPSKKH